VATGNTEPTIEATLTISACAKCLAPAREWLARHMRAAGFTSHAILDAQVALDEALTNAIEHAYGGEGRGEVYVALTIDSQALRLTVRDRGGPFRLEDYTPPDLATPGERGYGVHLIRHLMDEVRYDTLPTGGTEVSMVKYRHSQ